MTTMETSISPELYACLATAEAVLVRKHTRDDGSEFAEIVACGTMENMELEAATPRLFIMLPGMASVTEYAIPVAELLPPDPQEEQP